MLEVTENAVVDDYEHLREILAPLVERGMTLAVDDFGAGAANMRHVDALAPTYLKLDRTLVADIASDPRKSAMVEALVRYTWRTDSQLVAEGVETTADLEHLRGLGVGAAQGYVLARPQAPWPSIELPALAVMRQSFALRGTLPSIICKSDALTAAEARDLFARDAQLAAITLIDGSERVGPLSRETASWRARVTVTARPWAWPARTCCSYGRARLAPRSSPWHWRATPTHATTRSSSSTRPGA